MKPMQALTVAVFAIAAPLAAPAPVAAPAPQWSPLPAGSLTANLPVLAEDGIGLLARFHFATHTADFERARAFYRMLGYTEGMSGFPLTNTHQMARALGMFDQCQYELAAGEVIGLPGSLNAAHIDLLQFKTPFDDAPPYALPNHLGMAYAALLTTDLASDAAFLKSQGVEFLSEPHGIAGDRFAFFRDPEGVLYKLMETAPPHGDPDRSMHLIAMPHIGVNVSDFDRSLAFYQALGYTEVKPLPTTGTIEEARAYGLDEPFQIKGAARAAAAGLPAAGNQDASALARSLRAATARPEATLLAGMHGDRGVDACRAEFKTESNLRFRV